MSESKIKFNPLRAHIEGAALYKPMEPSQRLASVVLQVFAYNATWADAFSSCFLSKFAVAGPHLMLW